MKTILALGNPGPEYLDTRHNVGWWLADRLRAEWSFPPFRRDGASARSEGRRTGHEVRLVKPLIYVNRSGRVLEALREEGPANFSVRDDLLVLVDDVDLEPGQLRLRDGGSSGGHRGLASVEEAAGTREYARLRIGVGRPPRPQIDLAEWVLAPPDGVEEETILATFQRAVRCAERWLEAGAREAMNDCNAPLPRGPAAAGHDARGGG